MSSRRRLIGVVAVFILLLGSMIIVIRAGLLFGTGISQLGKPVVLSSALQINQHEGSYALCNRAGRLIFPPTVVGGDRGVTRVGRYGDSIVVQAIGAGTPSCGDWAIYYVETGERRWHGTFEEFIQRQASDPLLSSVRMEESEAVMRRPSLVGGWY